MPHDKGEPPQGRGCWAVASAAELERPLRAELPAQARLPGDKRGSAPCGNAVALLVTLVLLYRLLYGVARLLARHVLDEIPQRVALSPLPATEVVRC